MIDQNVTISIVNSLISRFKAQKDEAIATIMIYMTNPTGIGEHPGIIEELDELFSKAAEADEKLKLLNDKFKIVPPQEEVGGD